MRGKVETTVASDLARLKQNTSKVLRETFVTQHQIKGNRPATSDGRTWTRWAAPFIDRIRVMHSASRNARATAQKMTRSIFVNLRDHEYDAVNYYMYVRDAYEDIMRGIRTRPGFTLDGDHGNVLKELTNAQAQIDAHPVAKQTLDSYLRIMRAVRDAALAEGILKPGDHTDFYYPHRMVDYIRDNAPRSVGVGRLRVKIPKNLMRRKGSYRDISTNMIDNTETYLTDILTAIEKHRTLNEIGRMADIRNNPTMLDKEKQPVQLVENQIPPGFREWSPTTGFARFRHGSVAERLLGEMMDVGSFDNLADAYGTDIASLHQILQKLGLDGPEAIAKLGASLMEKDPGKTYIIPEELAKTLDEAVLQSNKQQISGLAEKFTRGWKSIVLNVAPVRYNTRNMIGDLQRMYVQFGAEIANPKMWQDVTASVKDYYVNKRIDARMQSMLDYAVSSSGRTQSELPQTLVDPRLRILEHGAETSPLKRAMILAHKALSVIPETSSAREDIVRGVIMEMNNRRMAEGKEPLYGIADPELVKGLLDGGEKERTSAYIARKSLLDYGDFTPRENAWRNGIFPFYSWLKGNFSFWSKTAANIGAGRAVRGPSMARASAMAGLKGAAGMAVLLGSVRLWNELVMGDYEETLPMHIRRTSHFIVPDFEEYTRTGEFRPLLDPKGNIRVWSVNDAFDDFLTYLGLDHLIPEMFSVSRGTLSAKESRERLMEWAGHGQSVPRTLFNQISPLVQFPVQQLAGKRLFPDPLHPTDIPPEQRASSLRDLLGVSSLGFPDAVMDAGSPGRDIFQPSTRFYDLPKQLGYQTLNEPTIYQEGQFQSGEATMTQYEVDLIRKIGQVEAELGDLAGRMEREAGSLSNRQLPDEHRSANLQTRIAIIRDEKARQLKELSARLSDLQRHRRLNHP